MNGTHSINYDVSPKSIGNFKRLDELVKRDVHCWMQASATYRGTATCTGLMDFFLATLVLSFHAFVPLVVLINEHSL